MKVFIKVYLLILLSQKGMAQHIDNHPNILKANGIKSLMICDDSSCSSCPVEYNEYDSSGRRTFHLEGSSEERWVSVYDHDKKIYDVEYYISDKQEIQILDTTFHHYDDKNNLLYSIKKTYSDGAKPFFKIDTILPKPVAELKTRRNKSGLIVSQKTGSIYRSCFSPSEGEHTLIYHYLNNGLIDYIDIFNSRKTLYMRWHFRYNK